MQNELSIVIVSYNCAEYVTKCVSSIYEQTTIFNVEIIIVDNNSSDNSEVIVKSRFPEVYWINSGYNSGFARANNLGIRAASGNLVLLLNPDTTIPSDFINQYVSFYHDKDQDGKLGLLGCRIVSSEDGHLLIGSGIGFPTLCKTFYEDPLIHLFRRLAKMRLSPKYNATVIHSTNHEVDFASGACVMIEKAKIVKNDLFLDEDFFLYYEDTEWSFRFKQKGFYNFYSAEFYVLHVNSGVTANTINKQNQILLSSYLFYYKTMNIFSYYLNGCLLLCSYLLNRFLLKRAGDLVNYKIYRNRLSLFVKYYFVLPKHFSQTPSSSKNYLKYVE